VTSWRWLRESRGLTTLLVSRIVSRVGDVLFALATTWVVLGSSHSVLLAAIIPLASSLPPVVFALPLATLADRWPKKLVMVAVDWGRALLVAGAGLLLLDHRPIAIVLYLTTLLLTMGGLLFSPAVTSTFTRMVPPEHLTKANGLWASVTSTLSIGSFAVGGILVAWLSPGWALMVDAVSFAVSGAVLALMPLPQVRADAKPGGMAFVRDSLAGIRYLWGDTYLRRLILVIAPMNLAFGPLQVFSLVFSRLILHAGTAGYGAIEAASGLGSVLAGLLVTRMAPRMKLQGWVRAATLGTGAALAIALMLHSLPVSIVCYGAMWFITALLSIPIVSSIERVAPAETVGRVMQSLFLLSSGISTPIGLLVGSWAMTNFGPVVALWAQVASFGAIGLVALLITINPPESHALSVQYQDADI